MEDKDDKFDTVVLAISYAIILLLISSGATIAGWGVFHHSGGYHQEARIAIGAAMTVFGTWLYFWGGERAN